MSKSKTKVIVKRNEEKPEPVEIIAESIIEVSRGFQKMRNTRLTEHAIVVLIHDHTGVAKGTIKRILAAAADLEKQYLKKIEPKK